MRSWHFWVILLFLVMNFVCLLGIYSSFNNKLTNIELEQYWNSEIRQFIHERYLTLKDLIIKLDNNENVVQELDGVISDTFEWEEE